MYTKRAFFLIIFIIAHFSTNAQSGSEYALQQSAGIVSDTLRIATYNVRVDTDAGHRAWANRKQHVGDIIYNLYSFDLFGTEELKNSTQESELMAYLPGYNNFSKGRNTTDGSSGERCAIIYKTARFTKLKSGFFFLSATPDVAGLGWDAKFNRICLWAKFNDKVTNQDFYFYSSHWDAAGVIARRESAKLILAKMKEIAGTEDLPTFLVGDFNSGSDQIPYSNLVNGGLIDSRTLPGKANIKGPLGTTNGWDKPSAGLTNRIDFIFVNQKVNVSYYITIDKMYYTDAYPSDHFPVMIKALIPGNLAGKPGLKSDSEVNIRVENNNKISFSSTIPYSYEIFNSLGVMVTSRQKEISENKIFSLENMSKGLYFVKTITNRGKSTTKIIIK